MIINSFMGPETEITKAEFRNAISYMGDAGKGYKYGLVTVTFREPGMYALFCARALVPSTGTSRLPSQTAGRTEGETPVGVQKLADGCFLLNVENANDSITFGHPGAHSNANYFSCCCFVYGNWGDSKSPLFERVV